MRHEGLLTLGRWLRDRARATPERVAIDYDGELTTYRELDRRAYALAAALHARGLRHGDRLATLTGNRPEHVAALFACARSGLVLCPLNWRLAPAELGVQLDDAEPALLLVEREHEALAEAALALAGVRPDRLPIEQDPSEGNGDAPNRAVADDDPLLLVYTSGSTGRPKGALLTHANCFWTNLGFDLAAGVSAEDVVLAPCRSSMSAAGTCTPCSPSGRAPPSCSSAASSRRARSS